MGVNQALHIGRVGVGSFQWIHYRHSGRDRRKPNYRGVFLYSGSHPWQWFPAVPAGMTVEGDSSDLSG